MLRIHDDMISATNELIKQSHVRHDKQIEKEFKQKDGFNMIMHEVLIKVIRSTQHFVDTPNHKFDTMLLVMEETLDTSMPKLHPNDAFQASHPTPPPILAPKITPVDDSPPTTKPDDLPEESLISPPLELFITPIGQQVISSTIPLNPPAKDKGKGISLN
ncbi:unnamed protein product [Lactuca saligna]|uniref:Uncharacterized protein n=1 Tax=Lactuca saligna TaxID=75948 RepID=A0AA35ZX11_LACSI|nr:unnamed protein product [Lactuca saligna]